MSKKVNVLYLKIKYKVKCNEIVKGALYRVILSLTINVPPF